MRRAVRLSPAACFVLLGLLPRFARADGHGRGSAADLGTHSFSARTLVACARRDAFEHRELALAAVAQICDAQNVRLREAGVPACEIGKCVDTLVHRDRPDPIVITVEASFDLPPGSFALGFRIPLGTSVGASAGWHLFCREPYDFLAWNGLLPQTEGFFAHWLSAAPGCDR